MDTGRDGTEVDRVEKTGEVRRRRAIDEKERQSEVGRRQGEVVRGRLGIVERDTGGDGKEAW